MPGASRGSRRRLSGAAAALNFLSLPCGPHPTLSSAASPTDLFCCGRSSGGLSRPPRTPVEAVGGSSIKINDI